MGEVKKTLPSSATASLAMVGTAAIIWAPYTSIPLEHRQALYLQAALILAITLGLLALGWHEWRRRPDRRLELSRPVLAGLGLYTAATILGTLVAIARANPTEYVIGQVYSMAILPVAAVAAILLGRAASLQRLAVAVVAATTAAVLFHFAHAALALSVGATLRRLYFPNHVTALAPSLLALLFALALAFGGRSRRTRALSWTAALLLALFIAGTGVRGLWLAVPVALVLFALFTRRPWLVAAPALALLPIGFLTYLALKPPEPRAEIPLAGGDRVFETSRGKGDVPRTKILAEDLPTPEPGWYGIRAKVAAEGTGRARMIVRWYDDAGERVASHRASGFEVAGGVHVVATQLSKPASARTVRLEIRQDQGRARWEIEELRFERVAGTARGAALDQLDFVTARLLGLGDLASPDGMAPEHPAEARLMESARLLDHLRAASPAWLILGHGLGATFDYVAPSGPSYIHNYPLFLLYKLGLVGGGLVLAVWIAWAATALHLSRPGRPETTRTLAAAIAAAVLSYLLWSVSSPELLNFRLTPVWGFVVGALAGSVDR